MKILSAIIIAVSFLANASTLPKVIYGKDDRLDFYEVQNDALQLAAEATVALVHKLNIKTSNSPNEVKLSTETLVESVGVCESERYAQQPTAAFCSGFLVAPNKVITAGHCVSNEDECAALSLVFDFKAHSENDIPTTVSTNNIYQCKKILGRSFDSSFFDSGESDWAIIELDREVTDRAHLKVRREGKPSVGDNLVVIGHPSGLPTKIAGGGQVRSLGEKEFIANLDTYGGNSGSAVLNLDTLEVEGILVSGEQDYVFDWSKGCRVSNICTDDGCRGESVTYINEVKIDAADMSFCPGSLGPVCRIIAPVFNGEF